MSRLLSSCLIALLLTSSAAAQRARSQRRGIPAYYQALEAIEDEGTRGRVVLRNGLRVLVDEYTIRPLVAVVSTFNVGQAQEAPSECGWLVELSRRLWLTGELNRQIRELGGWNEFESRLYDSAFISIAPAENVLNVLGLHYQILVKQPGEKGDSVVPTQVPRVMSRLESRLWNEAFGPEKSGARTPPTQAALGAFRDKHLQVGNLVLGLSGNILRTRIYERVVGLYGRLKSGPKVPRPAAGTSLGSAFAYVHLRGGGTSERLLMGYRMPPVGHPDSDAIEMITALLSAGRGSLLQRTQVGSGFSARASASLEEDRRGRLLRIELAPREGKVDSAELAVLSLLEVLARKGPPDTDLVRARAQLVRQYFARREQVRERALGISRAELAGNHKDFWNRAKALAAFGSAEIKAVAGRYFQQSNLVLIEQFPESGEIRNFDAATWQQTFKLLLAPEREKLAEELATTPKTEVKDLAFANFKPSLLDPPLKRTSVLRGPDIYLEEEHTVPLVTAGFYFPGGRAEETERIAGITELMLRGILTGVEERQGIAVWMPFETRGAVFELVNEPEYFGIEISVLDDAFSPLLKDVVRWFRQPEISESNFQKVRAQVTALFDEAAADPKSRSDQEIRAALFSDHPYGKGRYGTPSSLSRLVAGDVQDWATRQLAGFHPFIVIRGNVNGTSFLPPLIPVLSNSKIKVKPGTRLSEGDGEPFHVVKENSRVVVGFRGPKRGSFDEWALDVLENLLALRDGVIPADVSLAQLSSPVWLEHREYFNSGVVSVSTLSANPAHAAESKSKLLKLLTGLERAPLPEQEVLRSIVLTITRFHADQEDSMSQLRELAHNLLAGEKVGYREEYLATIKGIQPSDLRSLVGRIFSLAARPAKEDPSN